MQWSDDRIGLWSRTSSFALDSAGCPGAGCRPVGYGRQVGPWFRWAWVGLDSAAMLARQVGLRMTGVHLIGEWVVADMAVL